MMRRTLPALLLLSTMALGACASRPVPRVERLGDGIFKSPSPEEAEAYCRNFGAPTRFLDPVKPGPGTTSITYRCD